MKSHYPENTDLFILLAKLFCIIASACAWEDVLFSVLPNALIALVRITAVFRMQTFNRLHQFSS